jgi:hypothetical protein
MKRLNVKNFYEFYQFPKVLVKSPKYRTMSDAAKIIYMLLLNRLTDSLMENNIDIDSEGYVYLFFSDEELSKLTGYSVGKVLSAKRELITKRLLRQVYVPSLKETRLYVGEVELGEGEEDNNKYLEELVL